MPFSAQVQRQVPKRITLTKASMPVLGERGMVGDLALQAQPAKPPVGQVVMHFLAQASFRADSCMGTSVVAAQLPFIARP